MKKIQITLLGALLLLTASCGSGTTGKTASIDGMEFDSIVADTTFRLVEGDEQSPSCHIKLNIQYAKGGKEAQALNDSLIHGGLLVPDYLALGKERLAMQVAIDSFVKRYAADYMKDYAPLYRQDRDHASSYNCEYVVNTTTRNGRDNVVNYVVDSYFYGGGDHGTQQTIVRNIDINTGRTLRLADIFVPGYDQGLTDKIVERICEKFKAKNLDELRKQVVFEGIDPYPSDNFVLGKDEVTFIYVEDEIAPHAVGEISVALPYSELDDLMKRE